MQSSELKLILPLAAGIVIGTLGIYTVPYQIGVVVDHLGISAEAAGWLAFVCVGGVALGSVTVGMWAQISKFHYAALSAAGVSMLAQLLSSFPLSLGYFVALQTIANLSAGLIMGLVTSRIAALPNPDRSYGQVFASMSVVLAVLLYGLPYLQDIWGPTSLFWILALVIAFLSVGLVFLPKQTIQELEPSNELPKLTTDQKLWVVLLFISMAIAFASNGGVYSFSERIALDLGMSSALTGMTLAASTIAAVIGATFASWIGGRGGRKIPFSGSILVAAFSFVLVLNASIPVEFMVGMVLYGLVSMFFTTYAYGTAAAIDSSGRIASALQGFSLLPYALGPGLLGAIAGQVGYKALAWPVFAVNMVAMVLILPVVCGLDRRVPVGQV